MHLEAIMVQRPGRTKVAISLEIDPDVRDRMLRRRDNMGQSLTYQLDRALRSWLDAQEVSRESTVETNS